MDIDYLNDPTVSVFIDPEMTAYPQKAPFHPSETFPEYPFGQDDISDEVNKVYAAVRTLFHQLGYDEGHFGTTSWNPLKGLVHPGDTVVLKPNFVLDANMRAGGGTDELITHGSVIRAVADYVYIALEGKGKIILGDAPQADANFDQIVAKMGLDILRDFYPCTADFSFELLDYRQLRFVYDENGMLGNNSRLSLDGDPNGYTVFDLGKNSAFEGLENIENIYGADYDRSETLKHHSGGKHEYCISGTILKADVFISLPKMKTHRKSGATLNLKNLVGINGNKNYLPHFRIGAPDDGGDEFPMLNQQQKTAYYTKRKMVDRLLVNPNPVKDFLFKTMAAVYRFIKPIVFKTVDEKKDLLAGGWYGNETVWRMILDLNRILVYGDADGNLQDTPQRRIFSVMDGVVAGDGDGPLAPERKECGALLAGRNTLCMDYIALRMMGLDARKIPLYKQLSPQMDYPLTYVNPQDLVVACNNEEAKQYVVHDTSVSLHFCPAPGWIGHIELE